MKREKTINIRLDGELHKLYFNLNTFEAFEKVSGRFFLDFITSLQEAVKNNQTVDDVTKEVKVDAMAVLRNISVRDIRAFLWSACHYYDNEGEPQWRMTLGQIGRLVTPDNITQLLPIILSGQAENSPEAKPESEDEESERPTSEAKNSIPIVGGTSFGPRDEDVLASLEKN